MLTDVFTEVIAGIFGILGIVLMIIYYILTKKIDEVREETKSEALTRDRSKRNTKNIRRLQDKVVTQSLCTQKHENVESRLDNINENLDEIKEMVDYLYRKNGGSEG